MQPELAALSNHKVMIAHKLNSNHRLRLLSVVTSFHERGYTAFDYHNYPLQAYILYGIGVTSDRAAVFQNKLCKQGHIWKDTILSSRCDHKPYNCYICRKVNQVNTWKHNGQKRKILGLPSQEFSTDYLKLAYSPADLIKAQGKAKQQEVKKLVEKGDLQKFKKGALCEKCNTDVKYTISKNCVKCTKESKSAYYRANADKVIRYNKERRLQNPEKFAEIDRKQYKKWAEENPEKAREKGNRRYERLTSAFSIPYEKEEFQSHLKDFEFKCAYCQKELDLNTNHGLHLDHFIALSKGGNNHLGNYVPACRSCNLSKSDKHPYVWYKEQSFFNRERWRHILAVLWKHQERYELYERDIIQLIQFT